MEREIKQEVEQNGLSDKFIFYGSAVRARSFSWTGSIQSNMYNNVGIPTERHSRDTTIVRIIR